MSDSESPEIPAKTAPAPAPEPAAPPRFLATLARRPFAVLALLGILLWLPGILSLPPLDRDESCFAQSSRQMVESGDLVDIRFGQVPRYKKPVGIYWLQAAFTAVLGMGDDSRIWTYRIPSLLGALVAAWATAWCALSFAGGEAALVAGLLMQGTVLLGAEATIATTDAVLLACALGVQGVLLRVYRAARDPEAHSVPTRLVMAGWAACAGGMLVKFPVVPGVALLTVVALAIWDREWKWLTALRPVRGFLFALLLTLPWLIAITLQSHGAFLEQSMGNDFASKLAGGQESHGMPPGYYLLLSAASLWPAILFIPPGVVLGIARRGEPTIRFLLAWAGAWWLVVEAVPTKLPHYILPAVPALAILAALFVLSPPPTVKWLPSWLKVARWLAAAQFLAGLALLGGAFLVAPRLLGGGEIWWLVVPAVAGALGALAALVLALRRAYVWALMLSLLAMLVFIPALTAGMAPRLAQLWVSQRLKVLVAGATMPGDPPPALAGYQEPSLVFALGKDVVLSDGAGAADAGARKGGLALVEDGERGVFLARLAELQADAVPVNELSGFNYSRGRPVHITLYRVTRLR